MTDRDTSGLEAGDVRHRAARRALDDLSAAKAGDPDENGGAVDARLTEHFVTLADALFAASSDGVIGVVECVVEAARVIVPGELVSVVLREDDGRLATVAYSDDVAERADRLQNDIGEGPSISAADRDGVGAAVSNDLLAPDPRVGDGAGVVWPGFGQRAADELGLHAVLSTGMFPGGDPPRFGALNVYSRTPDAFDDAARDHALVLAAHAATAISAVQARTAGELREAQLAEALRSRDVIGQAKGILMERRGQSAEEAFAVLQRASQDLNIKLRDVAQTLVAHRDVI